MAQKCSRGREIAREQERKPRPWRLAPVALLVVIAVALVVRFT